MANSQQKVTPQDTKSMIKKELGSVTSEQIEAYKAYKDVETNDYKIKAKLDTWKSQQEAERGLRKLVTISILVGLFIELIAGNVILFLIGFGIMSLDEWIANIFFVGMYTQIITITLIVVKNLFPSTKKDNLEAINNIVKDL